MRSLVRIGSALCLVGGIGSAILASTPEEAPSALTVIVDLVVEDAKGRPVPNLTPEDIIVVQDRTQQHITKLVAKSRPGHYELSYVPASGKAGAVSVQLMRPGTRARGLEGPGLKPRVVQPLSPLATELTRILETRPDADDFRSLASVLRFEAAPDGVHHTLVVEVPLAGLTVAQKGGQYVGRVQIFARLSDGEGRVLQRFDVDRALSASSPTQLQIQRLVWTGQIHLRKGHYVLDTVARDPETAKASVRRVSFDTLEPEPRLRISNVALLHPMESLMVRDHGREIDDPFLLAGEPVMPTLELKTTAAPGVKVEFFAILYPDRTNPDPVTLRLDLMRGGDVVGTVPLGLPTADERGEIRYAGGMATRTLRPAEYQLRLLAQQGPMGVAEEVAFTVLSESGAPLMRVGETAPAPRPALTSRPRAAPALPSLPEMMEAEAFVRRQQYDQAIRTLKKADQAVNGSRADVKLLLAIAYYRFGAHKDAETAARGAVELARDTPMAAEAYVVLGRALAGGEKKPVRSDSERLRAAEDAFRKALAASDGQSEAGQLALAEVLYRLDRIDEGRAVLNALLKKPDSTDAGAARAQQLLQSPRCAMEACLPQLAFVTSGGRRCTSEELRGKVVLLSFWATWCQPCVAAVPELKRLHAKYEKEPFVMVGINLDRDRSTMEKFVEANRIGWPQVSDESSGRLGDAVASQGIPTEALFDHEGVLVGRSTGWGSQTGRAILLRVQEAIDKAKKARKQAQPPSS